MVQTVRLHCEDCAMACRRNRRTECARRLIQPPFPSRPVLRRKRMLTDNILQSRRRRPFPHTDSRQRQHRSPTESGRGACTGLGGTGRQIRERTERTLRLHAPAASETPVPEGISRVMDAMDSPILIRSRNCNRRHINRNLTPSPLLTPRCLNYIVAVLGYRKRPLSA